MLQQGKGSLRRQRSVRGNARERRFILSRSSRAFAFSPAAFKNTLMRTGVVLVTISVLALISVFSSAAKPVAAATSSYLNFQGRLLGSSGSLVADGTYNIEFNLYYSSGGSLWTEDDIVSTGHGVVIKNGFFSVNLGATNALPSTIDWDQQTYLGMTVRGTGSCVFGACTPTDAEMTPRFQLTAVPYAFSAGQLQSSATPGGFTSTVNLTTPTANRSILFPDAGGTAILQTSTFTTNGVVYANANSTAVSTAAGTTGQCLVATSAAPPGWSSCAGSGSGVTLQAAYDNGNAVTTTNARDVTFNLANTATDPNFLVNIASGSTSRFAVQNNGTDVLGVTSTGATLAGTLAVTGTTTINTSGSAATSIGASGGTLTVTGNSSSSFVINGITISAAEFGYLDGVTSNIQTQLNARLTAEADTLSTVTGRGASTATASTFTGGAAIRGLTVDTATGTQDRILVTAAAVGAARFDGSITNADLTAARTYTLPDASGTFAVTASGNIALSAAGNISLTGTVGTGNGGTGVTTAPTNGQLLVGNGASYSVATLANNGGVTITTGSGTLGLAVAYGSSSNTAAQGNVTFVCPSGTGNLSGAGNTITVGTGGTCNSLTVINNPTFSGLITGQAGFTATNGGAIAFQKDATDNTTTGNVNNMAVAGALIRLNGASAQTLTGIAGGADGRIITLFNIAATALTINNNDTVNSSAGNRIVTGTGASVSVPSGSSVQLVYDSGASFWRIEGAVAGSSGSGVTSAGAITGTNANGLNISSGVINLSIADGTYGGALTAGPQTIGGAKTFNTAIIAPTTSNTINGLVVNAGALSSVSTVNASGIITSVGVTAGAGLIQGSGGLTITGTTSIGATAGNTTTIGNTTGALSLVGSSASSLAFGGVSVSGTEVGYLSGVTSNIQTQLNTKLSAEADTLSTVTGRGATTATASSFTGGAAIRGLAVDTATGTQDRILVTAAAVGGARFDGSITNADLTAARTYTLPDASGTLAVSASGNIALSAAGNISLTGTVGTGNGGTGVTTFTSNGILYGNAGGALQVTAASTGANQCLITASSGGAPSWGSCLAGGGVTTTTAISGSAANGLNISGANINLTIADFSNGGALTAGPQNIGGAKTFNTALIAPTSSNTINGAVINSGALSSITGYTQASGNATFNQNAADILTVTSGSNVPTTDQAVITNTGSAGTATAAVNNLNLQFKGSTTTAVENGSLRVDLTPGTFSGSTTNGLRVLVTAAPAAGTTVNGFKLDGITTGGAGTYTGLLLNGITTLGAGTETAISIQSNWDAALRVGANVILNGSGVIQSVAVAGSYTGITGTGALDAGSITSNFGSINNGASGITTTGAISGGTLSASSTVNFSGLTASRALFTDASKNLVSSAASASLLNALTDETGSGVVVFGTSPAITTSLTTGSSSFDLLNTTATTVNAFGAGTSITLGAATGGTTIRNAVTIPVTASLLLGTSSSANGQILFRQSAGANTVTLQAPTSAVGGNYSLSIPVLTANDTLCVSSLSNCSAVGAASGALAGSYPSPTIANLTTTGSVAFVSGTSGILQQDNANFFFDSTNHRLAVGTSTVGTSRLTVNNAATTDSIFVAQDNGTPVFTIADGGTILAGNTATGTTGTSSGTGGTNVVSVTLSAAGGFANGDVIFVDNTGGSGQDYYTRITAGGGTTTLTVDPAVSYGTAGGYTGNATITKYNIQNVGAASSGTTFADSARFFQGYFLGGIRTGAGSTVYSDQNITSSQALYLNTGGQNTRLSISSAGNVGIGNTNNTYKLDVSGDINISTGSVYRVNGTAGASTTCSGGQFLQNQATVGGITTGGTCASVTTGTITGGGTANQVAYFSGASALTSDAGLTYSGGQLGINNLSATAQSTFYIFANNASNTASTMQVRGYTGEGIVVQPYDAVSRAAISVRDSSGAYMAEWRMTGEFRSKDTGIGLSFLSDSTTGIGRTGASALAVYTGGTARLSIDSGGAATFSGSVTAGGNQFSNGTDSWLRTSGNTGWYSTWGGGWNMSDSTWIRSYGSKAVYMDQGFDTASVGAVGCGGGLGGGYNFRVCGTQDVTSNLTVGGNVTVGSGLFIPDGTNAAPGIAFTNDTSTGLMRAGTSSFRLVAGGVDVLSYGIGIVNLLGGYTNGAVTIDANTQYTQRLCFNGSNGAAQNNVLLGDCNAAGQADLAEMYDTHGNLEPGDVVLPEGSYMVNKPSSTNSQQVIGVVSTNPTADGIIGYNVTSPNSQPVALAGRIPVKVSLENGPIVVGDYLAPASTPGFVMKAIAPGKVVGVAMENYDGSQPRVSALVAAEEADRNIAHATDLPFYVSNPSLWPAGTAKIMMFLNVTFYSPSNASMLQGNGLNITGNSLLNGDAAISGNLTVTGSSSLASLTVSGHTTLASLTVTADTTLVKLTVTGDTVVQQLTVNGHIITAGNAPTAVLGANTGQGSSATIDGNDTAGTITYTAGTQQLPANPLAAGDQVTVTFAKPYDKAPRITLTPTSDKAANVHYYVTQSTSSFKIVFTDLPAAGDIYGFNYQIIQ